MCDLIFDSFFKTYSHVLEEFLSATIDIRPMKVECVFYHEDNPYRATIKGMLIYEDATSPIKQIAIHLHYQKK